jgi:hypothetical protein
VLPLRARVLAAAAASSLAVVLLPALPAAAAPAVSLSAVAFSEAHVDTTAGPATVDLTWTARDSAPAATGIGGVVELGQFVGDTRVGPVRQVSWNIEPGLGDVYAASGDIRESSYRYTFSVPQPGATAAATWRVIRITAKDDKSHTAKLIGTVAAFTVAQPADTSAPELTSAGVEWGQPTAIYDDGTGVTIKYLVYATDDAGLWRGRLVLAGPEGRRIATPFAVKDVGGWALECGAGHDVYEPPTWATCGVPVTLPAGTPAGTWTVARVDLTDVNGNTRHISKPASTPVRVSHNDVVTATDFRLDPPVVDNWRTSKTSDLVFTPHGAVDGLKSVAVDSSGCSVPSSTPAMRDDGTAAVTLVAATFTSSCVIRGVALTDGAGHESFYGTAYGNADLGLTLTRVPDTTPPVALSAVLPKSTWTQSELATAWGIGIDVVVDNSSGAPVTGESATTYDYRGWSVGGGSGGVQEGPNGELGLAVHVGVLPVGTYTIGFTLTDAAGHNSAYGYPNRTTQPPGGPLILTVVEG